MSADTSHREFILSASTLIERMMDIMSSSADGYRPEEPHRMNVYLKDWSGALEVLVYGLVPETEAQDELRAASLRILHFTKELVDEILTTRVVALYESQFQNGLMLAFLIGSLAKTLAHIQRHFKLAISGMECDGCEGGCLQSLKEEWSEAQADRNSVKLFLLVMFLQKNESRLPRNLIVEMIDYARENYWSHCPLIYQEALHALRLGEKVIFPVTMHFIPR